MDLFLLPFAPKHTSFTFGPETNARAALNLSEQIYCLAFFSPTVPLSSCKTSYVSQSNYPKKKFMDLFLLPFAPKHTSFTFGPETNARAALNLSEQIYCLAFFSPTVPLSSCKTSYVSQSNYPHTHAFSKIGHEHNEQF